MRCVPKAARRRRRSPPFASSLAFRMPFSPSSGSKNPRRRSRSGPATPVIALLGAWAREQGLAALLTGHHADDQAETLMMRLLRGAGVKGLAGMRSVAKAPGAQMALLRPLLGWRRSELVQLCADAGIIRSKIQAMSTNSSSGFGSARRSPRRTGSIPAAVALSANNLAQADAALHWATSQEWKRAVTNGNGQIVYRPTDAPREIRRRIARRAILSLASEGGRGYPRAGARHDPRGACERPQGDGARRRLRRRQAMAVRQSAPPHGLNVHAAPRLALLLGPMRLF